MSGARRWVAASLLLCAGACVSPGPVPQDRFYRLTAGEEAAAPLPSPRYDGILAVERFTADGLTGQRAILYRRSDQLFEVGRHHYHYWVEPPTRMLQEQLADYLRKRGVAAMVVTPEMRIRADYLVTGRIRRFERLLGNRPHVVVELRLVLKQVSASRLLWTRTYRVEHPATSGEVIDSVVAFDRGVEDLFARFVADISRE